MKKMLITLTAAGALAVPMGVAAAQGGQGNGPNGPGQHGDGVPTCEQARDQVREHDHGNGDQTQQRTQRRDGGCAAADIAAVPDEVIVVESDTPEQTQEQTQLQDGTGDSTQNQTRERTRADDGAQNQNGERATSQNRQRNR